MTKKVIDDNPITFNVNYRTNPEELFKFICAFLPFGSVMELYRLLDDAINCKIVIEEDNKNK